MRRNWIRALALVVLGGGLACSGPKASSVQDVLKDPAEHLGENLVLSGQIEQVINPTAFVMEDRSPGGREVLVLTSKPLSPTIAPPRNLNELKYQLENQGVRVSGPIKLFNLYQAERELGIDLDDMALRQFEGKLVIFADDVQFKR